MEMMKNMNEQPTYDSLLKQALVATTKRGIRRGILCLIVGVILCVTCYQLIEGPAPTLTEDNMFDFANPNIRYKYGMWASGLVAYIGIVLLFVHRGIQKQLQD
jgi:hypothetical protein